jgi:copper chaperone CopZ
MNLKLVILGFSVVYALSALSSGHRHSGESHHGGGRHHETEHHDQHHQDTEYCQENHAGTAATKRSDKHVDNHDEIHKVSLSTKTGSISGTVQLGVNGMMCSSCRDKLETSVKSIPEVASVTADVKSKTMTITLSAPISRLALEQKIKNAGFNPQ